MSSKSETNRILALLASAGAEVRTTLSAHDATWDVYDALPGEERGGDTSYWKTGQVGRFQWTCFRPREPRSVESAGEHGTISCPRCGGDTTEADLTYSGCGACRAEIAAGEPNSQSVPRP